MRKILVGGQRSLSVPANAGLTLLRVFTGIALAFGHGIGKIPPSKGFIETTAKLGFPAPAIFAWAAALSEFLGGVLLAIGLLTRPAAFFIAFTMLVALIGVHRADPFQKQELAFLYFFIALAFLFKGSGDWSIDALLRKG
ncbi:MAG: DoxX family protein [Blastocatellia bacterium]